MSSSEDLATLAARGMQLVEHEWEDPDALRQGLRQLAEAVQAEAVLQQSRTLNHAAVLEQANARIKTLTAEGAGHLESEGGSTDQHGRIVHLLGPDPECQVCDELYGEANLLRDLVKAVTAVEADRLRQDHDVWKALALGSSEAHSNDIAKLEDAEATITTLRAQIQHVAAKLAPDRPSFSDLFDGEVPSSSGTRICLDMMQIQDHEAWMAAGLQRWMKVDDVERHMRQLQQQLLEFSQPAKAVE